jgi:hypothetical protein
MPYSTKPYVIGAVAAAVLAAGMTTATAQAADQPTCSWTVQKLASAPGFKQSFSYGTDHVGHVFGAVTNDSGLTQTPAVWSTNPATPPRLLGSAHGSTTWITGLSPSGLAVGYYHDNTTGRHAVRYVNGGYQDLPVPPGAGESEADGVNARGDIVGTVNGDTIILWHGSDPGYTLLPKPAGESAGATSIDDAGDILGVTSHDDVFTDYLWTKSGKAVPLRSATPGGRASANAIRNGRIVGEDTGDAVVWDLSGHVVWRLARHGALSINAAGLVYGFQSVPDGAIDQLLRNGKVLAPLPTNPSFSGSGGNSALTDSGLLAGRVDGQAATTLCH